jgi:hypothetical protein
MNSTYLHPFVQDGIFITVAVLGLKLLNGEGKLIWYQVDPKCVMIKSQL